MGKRVRSEDLQKFWTDANTLRKRGKFRGVRPETVFEEAAAAAKGINVATARRDARLFQSAHDSKSSTYKLPVYVRKYLDNRIAELPENQLKGKCVHDVTPALNPGRIIHADRPRAELR